MTKRKIANPLALAVLACLWERPMHPYEIATTLRTRGKHESIKLNYGSLYSVIESLKRHDLIVAQETEREGGRPERTVYRLTDAGRLELVDWLAELLSTPVKEYTQFEAALSLMPALPLEDVVALLEQRCVRLEIELAQTRTARRFAEEQAVPRLFLVEDEYRTAMLDAELEWTRKLVREITSGEMEGIAGWIGLHEERAAGSAERRPTGNDT